MLSQMAMQDMTVALRLYKSLQDAGLKVPAAGLTADVDYLNCFRIPGY